MDEWIVEGIRRRKFNQATAKRFRFSLLQGALGSFFSTTTCTSHCGCGVLSARTFQSKQLRREYLAPSTAVVRAFRASRFEIKEKPVEVGTDDGHNFLCW
jgi:hypothetical protein